MNRLLGRARVAGLGSLVFVAVVVLVLAIAEGVSSLAIVTYEVAFPGPGNGRTQLDEFLGWSPRPNVFLPNGFGLTKYVRINGRGFRSDAETEIGVPDGKVRVICSGDSFTFGQGVANDRTWCHLLSQLDPRIETANLGYPGYGVDQAFLRYRRDGTSVDHDIHLFAFVGGDFGRMGRTAHHGVQKPILRLERRELTVGNVPVSRFKTRVAKGLLTAGERLRSVDFVRRVWRRLVRGPRGHAEVQKIGPVARAVFTELDVLARRQRAAVVFVFLPTEVDLQRDSQWHQWVRAAFDSLRFSFVDLTEPMRALPPGETATFFIPHGTEDGGHYTEAGNAWVAEVLLAELQQIPEVHDAMDRNRLHR